MDFSIILDRLDFWKRQERKMQDAMANFVEAVASGSHTPVLDVSLVDAFIEGIGANSPLLRSWLEYYAWEAEGYRKWPCSQIVNGEEIKCENAGDKVLFADFLDKIFN